MYFKVITLKQFIKLFMEFVLQMLPVCFLMVSLVRFECFISSLDVVLVTTRAVEIGYAVRLQGLRGRV